MATTVICHNSFVSSHIESTFGTEVLWDNRHQPHTLLPWKLQSCHELNMTNALLMFHSGCHGNQVSTVMKYEADAYCPKEPLYKMWTQYDLRQRSY